MKIYYITNARIPTEKANGYQIVKTCESLATRGAEVELWVPKRKGLLSTADPFAYYSIERSFTIRQIKSFDTIHWLGWLPKLGFVLQSLFFFISLLVKKVESNSVIYSRSPEIIWLFGARGYKTFWESHGAYANWNQNPWFLRCVMRMAVLTESSRKKYIELGVDPKKIIVLPDSVDIRVFDASISQEVARAKFAIPANKSTLGYFGSLNTVNLAKGMDEIIQALKILPDDVLLISVGGNAKDMIRYQGLAKREGVDKKILFKGQVSRGTLAEYQKACDILLMPFPRTTHFAYYMSPLKMFEYMASKRPIIATDLPSIREVLSEQTATIIPPGDPKALAQAVRSLLAHPEQSKKLSENAFEKVKEYTWQKRADSIIRFAETIS